MPEISKPIPAVTPDMREFFDGARAGRLMVQKCDDCGTLRFPAHELCSKCNSTGLELGARERPRRSV